MEDGIRFAETAEEQHAAYRLRYKTYVQTMGRFNDNCDHLRQELRDKYDDSARTVVAIKNNQAIGTLRVLWGRDSAFDQHLKNAYRIEPFLDVVDPSKICVVERLMVDESHRGSATMLRMFNAVMHFILEQQIELLLINAEAHHSNSYVRLGCRPFTKQYLYPGIGPVTPMALVVGDYQHLQRVGSPFSLLATADDVNYCRHTHAFTNIIRHESTNISAPKKQSHSILPRLTAANNPLFARKPSTFNHRLRTRLATI